MALVIEPLFKHIRHIPITIEALRRFSEISFSEREDLFLLLRPEQYQKQKLRPDAVLLELLESALNVLAVLVLFSLFFAVVSFNEEFNEEDYIPAA